MDLIQIAAGIMRLYARTLLCEDVHLTKEEGYKIQDLQKLDVDKKIKEKFKKFRQTMPKY